MKIVKFSVILLLIIFKSIEKENIFFKKNQIALGKDKIIDFIWIKLRRFPDQLRFLRR